MNQTYCDLREKEVINMNDCKRLGYISDFCIDVECGKVVSFTVRDCTGIIPGKGNQIQIMWEDIKKIGDDIIFVDICYTPLPPPPKKRFFESN